MIGTFNSPGGAERVRALGAKPVQLDLLDARAVRKSVLEARARRDRRTRRPRWPTSRFSRNFDSVFAQTNRLRTEGTDALLAAAREAGVGRFVAQSYASARYAREGGPSRPRTTRSIRTRRSMRESHAAMRHLDEAVTDAGGIVLRYGGFYGADNDGLIEPVRKRQFPIVGDGGGVTSFIHLDDAAAATVLALEHGAPGIYHVVDDEPAPVREWLPVMAEVLGAKPPRHFPRWLARLIAGDAMVMIATESRGASNAKAKRELGWTLRYPSWREGFAAAYGGAEAVTPIEVGRRAASGGPEALPVQVGNQVVDARRDVVADCAHLIDRQPLRVGQVPVDVPLAGDVGALVAAAHRHDHVGALRHLAGQPLRPPRRSGRRPARA